MRQTSILIIFNLMNFSYQKYVERMNYEPYQWPPDISLAELHSRVSEQGPVNDIGVRCPCCNFQSKKKFKGWIMRDIAEDCEKYGTAVPAFFGMLKFYLCAIFLVMLINSIYPLWAMFHTCKDIEPTIHPLASDDRCLHIGVLYYLDYDYEINLLKNYDPPIYNNLIILETVAYYILLLVNVGSLFYLFYMEKQEEKIKLKHHDIVNNALILGSLPQTNHEKLKARLDVQTNLEIADIIPLKEAKRYANLFKKRNLLYYKLMSQFVMSEDPRDDRKLNAKLQTLHKELLKEKEQLHSAPHSNLLIVFKTPYMATMVFENYEFSQLNQLIFGSRAILRQAGLSNEVLELPIHAMRVPHISEIKWQNAGESAKSKLTGRIKSFFIAISLIIICIFLLLEPMRWSLAVHASAGTTTLSTFSKILPFIISLILVFISIIYRNYMVEVAKRRNPLNEFEASKFVLMSSMLFHVIFYIIIPTLFFMIGTKINPTVKLYVIATQARTFIVVQLIICIIDLPYRIWQIKKTRSLSDQRQAFKYNQRMLHQIVEYRDFPLEIRLQAMFKIWSFALFYIFYLPYVIFYMFVALIILYVLEKHNFYMHYTLRRVISLKLEKTFLIYFVNFFCVFQCIAYCWRAPEQWMIIASVVVTLALMLLNLLYWQCVQPEIRKHIVKKREQALTENLVSKESMEKEEEEMQWAKQQAQEYADSYKKWMDDINNQQLDDEITAYLKTAKLEVTAETAEAPRRETQIEMASDIDVENDSD